MPRNRLFAVLSLLTLLALLVTSGLAVAQDTRLPPQQSLAPEHANPESALRSSPVMFHPALTAWIIGARSPEQLADSLAALDIKMTPALRAAISALSPEPPPATDRTEISKTT